VWPKDWITGKPKAQTIVNVMKAFGWTGTRQKPVHQREKDPNVLQSGILANGVLVSNVARVLNQSFLAEIALDSKSAPDLIENIFLRFLGRLPNQREQISALNLISVGFNNRILPRGNLHKPEEPEKLPLITWFNHLSPEANIIQMQVKKQVRQGRPVDPRITPDWRERYEDLIWSFINHREFDGGGGRGHQGEAMTCVLAGGGLNHCGAYGRTDEISKKIVENPVSVPDFFATVCAAMQIDSGKYLYDGDRPVPITDNGKPIRQLFS
jgi:hypothetical protein